jgi:ABC-type glycerol-3-phosphate transport system substrate-binding protein
MGWNVAITDKAGIKENPPRDWDLYLAFGTQVVENKSAPYGVAFDAHGWRSLAPFTHSKNTDVYYHDGAGGLLFDFTHPDSLWALDLMRQMMSLSQPNVLNPGTTDGGVNQTPDEDAFAAQQVAYYCKYQSAPLQFASTWPDPKKLGLAPIPKAQGGVGSTVFWSTGSCLFKYGQNKDRAAEYLKKLTYDERIWKGSIAGSPTAHPGHLPPYKSLYTQWQRSKPEWMQDFVPLLRSQLDVAKAIPAHRLGLTQFTLGQPHWEKHLKGEEPDIKKAAQAAKDAVAAEIKWNP